MRFADVKIDPPDIDRAHSEWVREISDLYENRLGTVGGVTFNLCNDLLPKSEWKMPDFGVSPPVVRNDPDQPKIWFPWFGPIQRGSKWPERQYSKGTRSGKDDTTVKPRQSEEEPLLVEIIARPGDHIFIKEVTSEPTYHKLEHKHDSEVRCAYLAIRHSDGNETPLKSPLIFRGKNELLNAITPLNALNDIDHRIREHIAIKNINNNTSKIKYNIYAERALIKLIDIRDMLTEPQFFDIDEFVNQGILLGFLWAKAETETDVKPKALARINASRASARGGEAARAKSVADANARWRNAAGKCVKAHHARDPSLSNNAMIEIFTSELAGRVPVNEKTLKTFVSWMRKSGQIGQRIPKPKLARARKLRQPAIDGSSKR